jgi:hypothetical protein
LKNSESKRSFKRDVSPLQSDEEPEDEGPKKQEEVEVEEDNIVIAAEDDIPNNTDKSIDFNA